MKSLLVNILGLQTDSDYDTDTASGSKQYRRYYLISLIVSGICENLRNVKRHRLILQEEIKRTLTKLMFATDGRTMPTTLRRKQGDD